MIKEIDLSKIFECLKDIGNYEDRKIGRNKINGLIVSTCYTSDCGYETAICDNEVHPVERYANQEDALKGHIKWCIKAKTIKTIIRLGWFLCEPEKIKLNRIYNNL